MIKKIYHIKEFTKIVEGQEKLENEGFSHDQFNDLYNFCFDNKANIQDADKVFTVYKRNGKRQIQFKNYVGMIETKSICLEILPKIHFSSEEKDSMNTKKIFLKMLSHLQNSPFSSFQYANQNIKKDFPILEIFIKAYIDEVEKLMKFGMRSRYIQVSDNINCVRGRILIQENIRKNICNKAKIFCEYDEYSSNILLNQIIKTTLLKLRNCTRTSKNYSTINTLLYHFEDIDSIKEIKKTIEAFELTNKLEKRYDQIIAWSKVFLLNSGFTNFSGNNQNIAILFPMERIFEDYIAFLLKKHINAYKIKTQDSRYFLIEDHKGSPRYKLRPDVVMNKENITSIKTEDTSNHELIILDTKWKKLNENKSSENYNIPISDMYQLYAYGKKYQKKENPSPKLILLYPKSENFSKTLSKFNYDGDLSLFAHPFDLEKILNNDNNVSIVGEVNKIIEVVFQN